MQIEKADFTKVKWQPSTGCYLCRGLSAQRSLRAMGYGSTRSWNRQTSLLVWTTDDLEGVKWPDSRAVLVLTPSYNTTLASSQGCWVKLVGQVTGASCHSSTTNPWVESRVTGYITSYSISIWQLIKPSTPKKAASLTGKNYKMEEAPITQ